ncbi:MAG TPA: hypothetical protein VEK08_23180 [Planctomycetota bacterium]|nr:hypothetical protein [Planctomycetota bacterium]
MTHSERRETLTRPLAEDGTELLFRPDLGADTYIHPRTRAVYLDLGGGNYQRTERVIDDLKCASPDRAAHDFPTDRPRGRPAYEVDLSVEGYA